MKLDGVLDATTVCRLWEERENLFKEREIDLGAVKHITSAGIALLVKWAKSGDNKANRLVLKHVPNAAKQAFVLFGVLELFDIQD